MGRGEAAGGLCHLCWDPGTGAEKGLGGNENGRHRGSQQGLEIKERKSIKREGRRIKPKAGKTGQKGNGDAWNRVQD